MKKLVLIISIGMLVFLMSCVPEGTFYIMDFNTMGGSEVASVDVAEGTLVERPKNPYNIGYDFEGWYTDETYSTRFDFSDRVYEDTEIFAKWRARKYFIKFMDDNENLIKYYQVEYLTDLSFVQYPTPPERTGLKFASWTKQVPEVMPASDFIIYAVYIEEDYRDLSN